MWSPISNWAASPTSLTIDRATASRFGITPATIDNTLYDAFGQRQINTLYTQLNQYHVILETDPKFQIDPQKLHDIYIQSSSTSSSSSAAASNTAGSSSGAGSGNAPSPGNALLTPSSTAGVSPRPRPPPRWSRPIAATTSRRIERQLDVGTVARVHCRDQRQRTVDRQHLDQHLLEREYVFERDHALDHGQPAGLRRRRIGAAGSRRYRAADAGPAERLHAASQTQSEALSINHRDSSRR